MYDLIGDIHGHADELVQLLETLGYEKGEGAYQRSDRKVIFLGDFIDRGPKIRQVLEIVRPNSDFAKEIGEWQKSNNQVSPDLVQLRSALRVKVGIPP